VNARRVRPPQFPEEPHCLELAKWVDRLYLPLEVPWAVVRVDALAVESWAPAPLAGQPVVRPLEADSIAAPVVEQGPEFEMQALVAHSRAEPEVLEAEADYMPELVASSVVGLDTARVAPAPGADCTPALGADCTPALEADCTLAPEESSAVELETARVALALGADCTLVVVHFLVWTVRE
jgi:hypothetical protein